MKKVKALKFKDGFFSEILLDSKDWFEQIKKKHITHADILELVSLTDTIDIWLDEEGKLTNQFPSIKFPADTLVGTLVFTQHDKEDVEKLVDIELISVIIALKKLPVSFYFNANIEYYVGVYGTLKQGRNNHYLLQEDGCEYIGNGTVKGSLYDNGYYPTYLEKGEDTIQMEIYKVTNTKVLHDLDQLEGVYNDHYIPIEREITLEDGTKKIIRFYRGNNNHNYMKRVNSNEKGIVIW